MIVANSRNDTEHRTCLTLCLTVLAHRDRGHGGPELVFVHGWSCDRSYWRHQVGDTGSLARHGIKVVSVPAVGHFIMLEDPVGFNQLLDQTIAELTAPRRTSWPSS
jgi:pimeloyl-ACP methyl ester carboxylesterase